MAQLFRKSINSVSRWAAAGAVPAFLLVLGTVYAVYRSPYTTLQNLPLEQPAPFSHEHHVSGLGIDCRYCHTSVERSSFAGLPPTETCMTCHSRVWTDAPVLAPVRDSLASGQPIRWTRVHQVPDFAFFNHSVHVQNGIGCSTCHGPVHRMPVVWKAESLSMRWCLDCHEAPQRFLRARDQIFNMDWEPPPDQLQRAAQLLHEYQISTNRLRQLRDCSMCHR